jgi:hypothetical protein
MELKWDEILIIAGFSVLLMISVYWMFELYKYNPAIM